MTWEAIVSIQGYSIISHCGGFMRNLWTRFAFILGVSATLTSPLSPLFAEEKPQGKEITFSLKGDAHSMDPYGLYEVITSGFLYNIYETLVNRDKDLNIVPGLATSWTSKSPTTWEFKLRENVKFHDGTPFTADDVVFSYQRAISEGSDVKAVISSIKELKKIDDLTIEITTHGPNPTLLAEIYGMAIMSKSWCEKNNAQKVAQVTKGESGFADLNANGTGPFKLEKRAPEIQTVLVRNHEWWGQFEGNIERVNFRPIPNDATRIAGLITGELDLITPVPLQDMKRIQAVSSLEVLTKPSLNTLYLVLNVGAKELPSSGLKGKNPLQDIKVREAIYRAIDMDAIKTRIMMNTSKPAALLVGPGVGGYSEELDKRLPYDPELSKKLLAEAGYPEGFTMTIDTPNDRYIKDETISQAIVSMLSKVGIKVKMNSQTKSKYFAKVLGGETEFYLMGWMPGTYDAHDTYFNLCASVKEGGRGKYNIGKYSNPEFDTLIDKVHTEMEPSKRQEFMKEMMLVQQKDMAQIPLHQESLVWGKRKNISVVQRADDYMCNFHLFKKD